MRNASFIPGFLFLITYIFSSLDTRTCYNIRVTYLLGFCTHLLAFVLVMTNYCEYHINSSFIIVGCLLMLFHHVEAQPFNEECCEPSCLSPQPVLRSTTESICQQCCLSEALGSCAAMSNIPWHSSSATGPGPYSPSSKLSFIATNVTK